MQSQWRLLGKCGGRSKLPHWSTEAKRYKQHSACSQPCLLVGGGGAQIGILRAVQSVCWGRGWNISLMSHFFWVDRIEERKTPITSGTSSRSVRGPNHVSKPLPPPSIFHGIFPSQCCKSFRWASFSTLNTPRVHAVSLFSFAAKHWFCFSLRKSCNSTFNRLQKKKKNKLCFGSFEKTKRGPWWRGVLAFTNPPTKISHFNCCWCVFLFVFFYLILCVRRRFRKGDKLKSTSPSKQFADNASA